MSAVYSILLSRDLKNQKVRPQQPPTTKIKKKSSGWRVRSK